MDGEYGLVLHDLLRCEVKGGARADEQCPNWAAFRLQWPDHSGLVCSVCMPTWVAALVDRYGSVVVSRASVDPADVVVF